MKKVLLLIAALCLLLPGCLSKGQSVEPASSALTSKSAAQSVEPTSSAVSVESESAELSAQQAEITDIIKCYFTALENDDTKHLRSL